MVRYEFGGGLGTILLSIRSGRIFFTLNEKDRNMLRAFYGTDSFYKSESGLSGKGTLLTGGKELVELPAYRATISKLTEAYPQIVFGAKIMLPVEGLDKGPAVAIRDGALYFMYSIEEIAFILCSSSDYERFPYYSPDKFHAVSYKYICKEILQKRFMVKWYGNKFETHNKQQKPPGLPYSFEFFVQKLLPLPTDVLEDVPDSDLSYIEKKMYLTKINGILMRKGYLGVPKEIINDPIFRQDVPTSTHEAGWVSQAFEEFKFAYKRVKNERIYAILQADDGTYYEDVISRVEWGTRPVLSWVNEFKLRISKKEIEVEQ